MIVLKVAAGITALMTGIFALLCLTFVALALGYWIAGVPVKCALVDCVTTSEGDVVVVEAKK